MNKAEWRTLTLITIALMSSVLCAVAPVSLYIGLIPISLATLIIYVYICVFSLRKCVGAVCVYILLGMIGIPVFSGYTSGMGQLMGPTGGFIAGYIIMCVVSGTLIRYTDRKNAVINMFILALGTLVLYIIGMCWYIVVTQSTWLQAIGVCVVPFVLTDIVKIIVAALGGVLIRKRLLSAGISL